MCAHKAHGRQSAKAAIKHAGRETTPQNAGAPAENLTNSCRAAAPPCTRRGEPNRPNSGSKSPAHTSARRANGRQRQRRPDQARRKSGRLPTSQEQGGGVPAEKTPGHRAQKPPQQRQVLQKRPLRQTVRHIGRRKTPPNRQNSHSLFCLPGGAL